MSEYINVEKFKVSQESVYLDLLADCLDGYSFNKIELQVRSKSHDGKGMVEKSYILTDEILQDFPNNKTNKLAIRIPLAILFGSEEEIQPSIYCLILKVVADPEIDHIGLNEYEEEFYTSDVNNAINYLIDSMLSLNGSCDPIPDDLIRNYLILYGHLAALESGQQSIAEEYFQILSNNFTKCGDETCRTCGSCGCSPQHIHKICNCG